METDDPATAADAVTVGVLATHTSKESKAICNAVADLGHEPVWLRTENTTVAVEDGTVTLDPDVDVVANRLLLSNVAEPAEGLGLAATLARTRPVLNEPSAVLTAVHKFATAVALAAADLPVPDAFLALAHDRLNDERHRYGDEAVYKTAIGTHGGGTWKIDADDPVNPTVGDRQAFLQELLDRDGERHSDLRVYVVGDEVVGAMRRFAPEGDWRTNVALGGDVADATADLDERVREIALRATETVGLDYAGVDLVEGYDGWSVLEVNPTAGFKGLFQACGVSPAPYVARLGIERAGGTVDDDRVARVAETLDDSRPDCLPTKPRPTTGERPVVGYIEDVAVAGTQGSTRVYAKSDTGATRSSIDTSLAGEIGAGPIKSMTRVKSGSVKQGAARPVVDIVVGIGGQRHTVTASVQDRSHMSYPLLLGRDILEHYRVDVQRRADDEADPDRDEE
ncbi:RimK family alpha-L-glutamate ligase [Halobaculum sp. MBLA0147]|uniref:RimK family alpha-L-glutamate ligase n=1 Tax=Halobaculum sp. MBLA0147 TaxID=3079934 RepID=UPI0035245E7A